MEWITSGNMALDAALGGSGFALGRIAEVFGPGATRVAMRAYEAAAGLYAGAPGLYEHAVLVVATPMSDLIPNVAKLAPMLTPGAKGPDLRLVHDLRSLWSLLTIAALGTKRLVVVVNYDVFESAEPWALPQIWKPERLMRNLCSVADRAQTTVLLATEHERGTQTAKFFASQRVQLRGRHAVVVKNKLAAPFQIANMPCPNCTDGSCVLCDDNGQVHA